MTTVAFCYLVGLLFLANSTEAHTPFLVAADTVLALFYIVAGSVAGWQNARHDD